jgi:hypothetical protein
MAEPQRKKWRRRKMETPYSRLTKIREAKTEAEANELLDNGFILIKAAEKRSPDGLGKQQDGSFFVYAMGKLKGVRPAQAQSDEPPNGHSTQPTAEKSIVDPAILESRPWRQYDNGSGEWTFVTSQDGSPLPELEPAREFLEKLRAGDDLTVGSYRYRLRDKFLKRYPADGQSN